MAETERPDGGSEIVARKIQELTHQPRRMRFGMDENKVAEQRQTVQIHDPQRPASVSSRRLPRRVKS